MVKIKQFVITHKKVDIRHDNKIKLLVGAVDYPFHFGS